MTDTPETNHIESNLGNSAHPILLCFCRKLERERDTAIAERDEARSRFNEIDLCQNSQSPCEWSLKLICEREELRKALSLAGRRCNQIHHPKSMQHGDSDPCPVEKFIEQVLWNQTK
jgi:hypothetical protein